MGDILENGLEAELNDEMGYSRYHYRNKDSDNSSSGHSAKTMKNRFDEVDIEEPHERKGNMSRNL